MKTVYVNTPGQMEFRDTNKPARQKGEVLLKLLYGGICGNDLGSYKGTLAYFGYPRIPGHKSSTEVMEVDKNNGQDLRPGMIVACNLYFSCGHCYSYEYGIVNVCTDNQTMRCQRDRAFQEYIIMPEERVYDRERLDPMLPAAIEPFCISYHSVNRIKVKSGDKTLVIGAGTVGVLAAVAIKARGTVIYIPDVFMGKLDMVGGFGVDGIILNDSSEGSDKVVREITGGNRFDITIEAVGLPSTFQNCIDMACFEGKVIIIGVGEENPDLNFTLLQKEELNVFGSRNVLKKDFVELIDLVKEGKAPVEGITTNIYKFEDKAKTFSDFANSPGNMPKVILDFTDR